LNGRWAEVIGMAWADDDFRSRLLADPKREMAQLGIDVAGLGDLRVVDEGPSETVLVVPRRPARLTAADKPKPDGGTTGDCQAPTTGDCVSPGRDKEPDKGGDAPAEPEKKKY
jgi:hypothetical protein